MRLSEHRRRPSHSSFRRADGNQLCLQQINSITPPVDLVFFKTGGWTVTEWLPRIFNHLFTRWSLVRTNCVWGLICSMLLQSPMGFEPMNSLPRSGSRFSHLRMGTVSHHHSSKFCIRGQGGIWTPDVTQKEGRFTVCILQPLGYLSKFVPFWRILWRKVPRLRRWTEYRALYEGAASVVRCYQGLSSIHHITNLGCWQLPVFVQA